MQTKRIILIVTSLLIVGFGIYLLVRPQFSPSPPSAMMENSPQPTNPSPTPQQPEEVYKGAVTTIAGRFSVKVPNGWTASISKNPSFTAIMFSRPNKLGALVYQPNVAPSIDENGIATWNGLTEHFFILLPAASQRFNPSAHLEVTSAPFQFDDGHVGTKYDVVKHSAEAKKWGGLQRDSEWHGRTYIYELNGQQVEAHLALYPSSGVDIPFYENVARTIQIVK